MRDILDVFGDLPDFPGSRLPKNRETGKKGAKNVDNPFAGVPFKKVIIKGEEKHLYTIGNVARILNRQAQTIRKWERKGWIPAPTYRTLKPSGAELLNAKQKGYRLYSREQVDVLVEALVRFNLDGTRTPNWQDASSWVNFIQYIKANWPK
jgi:hypothetical protein